MVSSPQAPHVYSISHEICKQFHFDMVILSVMCGFLWLIDQYPSGPWFNIKMSSYQCRKSYCGDKMVVRSSYLHNGISYTGKMSSLYWTIAQDCSPGTRAIFDSILILYKQNSFSSFKSLMLSMDVNRRSQSPIFCYIRAKSDTKCHPMSPELKALQYLHLAIMSMVAKKLQF